MIRNQGLRERFDHWRKNIAANWKDRLGRKNGALTIEAEVQVEAPRKQGRRWGFYLPLARPSKHRKAHTGSRRRNVRLYAKRLKARRRAAHHNLVMRHRLKYG